MRVYNISRHASNDHTCSFSGDGLISASLTKEERKKNSAFLVAKQSGKSESFKFAPSGQIKSLIDLGDYIYFCSNHYILDLFNTHRQNNKRT